MKYTKLCHLAFAATLLTVTASAQASSLLEKIAISVLADQFGIDTSQVNTLMGQTKAPVYELAPVYQASRYYQQKPTTIWKLRQEGLGWGEIAKRVGMQPGRFNQLRKQGAFDKTVFWTNTYSNRFSVPQTQVRTLHQSSGSFEDVLGSILVGKMTNRSPATVYNEYKAQQSWTTVTNSHNVRLVEWRRVSAPVRVSYLPTARQTKSYYSKYDSDKGGRGNGKSVTKKWKKSGDSNRYRGNGQGNQGNGKGKNKNKGNGNGNGRGNGKGNGKGKG